MCSAATFTKHSGWFFVRYNVTEIVDAQPKRVQRSHRLCAKGGKYYARDCKAVKLLRDEYMLKINQGQQSRHIHHQDMRIADFWEHRYLPYLEEVVTLTGKPRKKPSTVRGYKQIWNQHLKAHFANRTLREYEPFMGTQFPQTLTSTQSKVTIKHIKALILEYDNGPFRIHPANHDRSRSFGYARIHLGE